MPHGSAVRRPGVPARPPFAFTLTAPPGWQVLRGEARTLRDDLVTFAARSPLWARLSDRQRRGAATLLTGLAQISAANGALATLLHLDSDDGELQAAAITLAWLRTAPLRADLDLARLVLGEDGDPVGTGLGPALVARTNMATFDDTQAQTTQIAAPLPDSIWLALISGTTTTPALADQTDTATLTVASALTLTR